MPIIDFKNVLKGLTVQEAMRRQVIRLPQTESLEQAIRFTIKYKVNAVLITDAQQEGLGVVSKTDLMGAYYAGLPVTTPLDAVMVGPPRFCRPSDTLDSALDTMRTHGIHRLYVSEEVSRRAGGVLAYPDIVGLLYRYCTRCDRNITLKGRGSEGVGEAFLVREVMTPGICAFKETHSLQGVMEGLAAYRLGAALITGAAGAPGGVVSKTDLILAFKHGVPVETQARAIMNAPVQATDGNELLLTALKQMIVADVHRIFVFREFPQNLVGVLSLSDVARFRSGTCRACLVSRIKIEDGR